LFLKLLHLQELIIAYMLIIEKTLNNQGNNVIKLFMSAICECS